MSAARERDGEVARIVVTPKTRAVNADGGKEQVGPFLASLGEGRLIHVTGKTSKKGRRITARRLRG